MDLFGNKKFAIFLGLALLITFVFGRVLDFRIKKELSVFALPSYNQAFGERVKTWKIVHRTFTVNNKYAFSMSLSPIDRVKDDSIIYLGIGDYFWKHKNSDTMYITRSLDTFIYVFDIDEMK